MNLLHWMKKEKSGLAMSTLELCKYEERLGHTVCVRQPGEDMPIYGRENGTQLHLIHSQLSARAYSDGIPKIMWMHGEPLSSVGNGISMKAIVDLAPKMDAFICMRKEELPIWSSIRRTFLVRKGVDLEEYRPLDGVTEKLSGDPCILYIENWRGARNPLYLCIAMQKVHQVFPNARLHLFNCPKGPMEDTFNALIKHNKWWPFIRTLAGATQNVNLLLNRCDIVVSCLFPLYARGIEAFAAGKAFIGPGYKEPGYPFTCDLDPDSIAAAIIKCWENYGAIDYRKWAAGRHDAKDMAAEALTVYERYVD